MKPNEAKVIPYVIFGVITTLYGFGVYYMLPLSMLSSNLGLMLQVFFMILLGYLFGLVLLAINLQHLMERFLLLVLLFWEKPSMKRLILNNLKAHQVKNKLTSTVFSMALGFLIFLLMQYKLLSQ